MGAQIQENLDLHSTAATSRGCEQLRQRHAANKKLASYDESRELNPIAWDPSYVSIRRLTQFR